MKRIYVFFLTLIALSLVFSCKKEITTDNVTTKITYYPVLTVIGAADTVLAVGETWVDPGAIVSTGIPYTKNDISTASAGLKFITYSAINDDGYSATATRKVFIAQAGDDNGIDRSGAYEGGRGATYSNSLGGDGTVILTKTSLAGVYLSSDINARYYEVWRDYGAAYRCSGVLRFNADNTVDMGSCMYANPWDPTASNSFITAGSGSVDGAGKITYKLTLGGSAVAAAFFIVPK